MYRGGKMMEIEYRIRRPQFDFFSLPNILAERAIVPERLQWDATPERVLGDVELLLADGREREAQLAAFEELSEELGEPHAVDRTVELVESLVTR
jgi:lipid-A-disaccharide synthase